MQTLCLAGANDHFFRSYWDLEIKQERRVVEHSAGERNFMLLSELFHFEEVSLPAQVLPFDYTSAVHLGV